MRKNRWHKNPVVALTLLITAALVFAVVPMMPAKVAAAGMPSKLAFTTVAQTIVAGGASKAITVQVQDATGNPINVSGNTTISLASTSGNGKFATRNSGPFSIRSVTVTRGNSSASFYYEDTTAGTPTITASCTSPRLTSATQQETVTASVTASKLAFTTAAQTITAGVASQVMTVQVEDTNGNPVNVTIAATIDLASTSGNGKFATSGSGTFNITSVTITSGNSSASFYYEDTTAGTPTITASCTTPSLTNVTQQETVTTVPKTDATNSTVVSASNSAVNASPTSVGADGTTTSTITVTLMDGNNNPVEGDTVSLIQDSGKSSNISSASGPTSSSGVVTFTVTDTTAESVIYTATDATDNIIIKQTAGVTFTVTAQGAGETVSSTATAKVVAALVQVAPTVALTYTGTPVIPFGMFTEGRNPGGSAWNSTGSDYGTVTVTPGSDASPSWTVNAFSDNSNGNFANGKMYSAVLNRYLGDAMYVDFSIDGGATWGTYGQLHTGTSVGGTNLSQNFWLGAAQNVSHADVVAGQGDYYIYVQLSAGVTP